jgi:hypothetical protein
MEVWPFCPLRIQFKEGTQETEGRENSNSEWGKGVIRGIRR